MLWFNKLFCGVIFLSFVHCGYTLSHRLKKGIDSSKGIFVPVFDNTTTEVGAERLFTNALIQELASRGNIVLSSRKEGGFELKGALTTLAINPTSWTPTPPWEGLDYRTTIPRELSVTAGITLSLIDPETGNSYWSGSYSATRRVNTPVNRTYDYQAPSSLALINSSIGETQFAVVAREIIRDVYDEMVELF